MARKVSRKEVARRREGKQLHQDPSLGKKTTKSKKKKKKIKADKKKAKETQALSNNNHRKPKTKAKSGSPASLFGPLRKEAKVKQCSLPSPDQPVRASRAQPKSKLEKIQRHRKAFQMSPVATTTNYAGTKRKRPKFELKLPALNAHQTARTYANMPWFNCRDDFTPDTTEDGKDGISVDEDFESSHSKALPIMSKSAVVLPTHQFSPEALQKLSDELQAFAAYVRLRPHEYQAREWLIQHITDLAGTKFTKNKNVAIQCFGSFATPEVCTFYSDVDLALHGVVEAPKLTRFDSSDEQHVEDTKQQEEDRKQAKVQKWRVLLQELQELQDEEKKEYDTALGSRGVELHSFESDFPRKAYSPASIRSEGARHGEQSGSENHVTQSSIPLFELDVAGDEVEQTHLPSDEQVVSAADVNRSCCDGEETGCRVQEIESDDDSADKLENLMASGRGERIFSSVAEGDESPTAQIQGASSIETEDSSDNITVLDTDVGSDQSPVRKRARLSYDQPSHHSTLHVHDDNDLGVSFHSKAPRMQTQVMGPIGDTRKSVLTALRNLGAAMRKSRVIDNVELRRHARVPIITSTSRLGFEADIAIGGHSGTDTSLFASMQVEKYKSFAPVILFLKILLQQQDLDKPFTGGIGSYKLYVLLSHHLEKHLLLGGSDEPGEVLLSFLYRFGAIRSPTTVARACETRLSKEEEIYCSGGSADLKPCHHLESCVELFNIGWSRLSENMQIVSIESYLKDMIKHNGLRAQRQHRLQCATRLNSYTNRGEGRTEGELLPVPARKVSDEVAQRGDYPLKRAAFLEEKSDADEAEILRGYGVSRYQNGVLVPLACPDLEQKPFWL